MKINFYLIAFSVCLLNNNLSNAQDRAYNDIAFWTNQYIEHAEFAADFAHNPKLKKEGLDLAKKVTKFAKNLPHHKNSASEFITISKEMKKYQHKVAAEIKKRKPLTKTTQLNLDLIEHMNKETDYAQKKAEGKKLSIEQETKFWSIEHEGEAKVMNTLMNDNALNLKVEAEHIENQLKNNAKSLRNSSLSVVERANEELSQIGKQLQENPEKSRVPEKLAAHEARERSYAKQLFSQLRSGKILIPE